jgi:CubicO group peptidase (beta-lactamase class C family)
MQVEGYLAPGFEAVGDAFRANFEPREDKSEELGAAFAAMRDGETLVNIWGGFTDRAQKKPWARDTLAPVFSTTKGVSAIVVAWCVGEGLLSYEQSVSALWPEFAAHGKGELTIAQALAHQAGLPGFPEPVDPAIWLDPPACAAALAAAAPMWPPGSASGYHPLTWGYIVGEIVARAAGRSLGAILREEICAPLGVDFMIGAPAQEHHRIPEIRKPMRAASFGALTPARKAAFFTPWANVSRTSERWREIEVPSANGHGAALAVAQLYGVFATEGMIESARVLSDQAFAGLTARRFLGDDLVLPFEVDWRSGVMANSHRFYGPNAEAIGHSGSGGSCGFGDPIERVSVAYVMNKQSPHLMGDPRALRLIEALYSCL